MTLQEFDTIIELLLPYNVKAHQLMTDDVNMSQFNINEMMINIGTNVKHYEKKCLENLSSFANNLLYSTKRIDAIKEDGRFIFLLENDYRLLHMIDSIINKHEDSCKAKRITYNSVLYDNTKYKIFYENFIHLSQPLFS